MKEGAMERVDYDQRQYAVYSQGRWLGFEAVAAWMRTFVAHCPSRRPLAVLDLGSGVGRFTPALAETFGGPAYGVEPSDRMREIAVRSVTAESVTYLAGSAERIPLPDRSCDVVVMFLVLHHVQDRRATAAEIARVLRPGGRVLVRSTFADRLPDKRWHHFFPRAVEIEKNLFPTLDDVVELFASVGLSRLALETVPVRDAVSLAEHAERLRHRAISTFEYLSEDEIARGFAALDAAVAEESTPRPVESTADLLVLGTTA
jgi:ubiquinone/menaquinone biosynthesis C-methylase UbiE